jgi:uncharacterized membrane protein YheB (UPF0754 family)
MISDIISKILAGSAVGYITNYLAIKMLFEEYFKVGKFSLGGVIVKERVEFEKQISQLVERDVLHHQAIDTELRKEEFQEVVQEVIRHLLQDELPKLWNDDFKIKDIPQIETTYQNLKKLLLSHLEPSATKLLETIGNKINLVDLFSTSQVESLSQKLLEISIDFLKDEPALLPFLENMLQGFASKSLSDFVDEKTFATLVQNIQNLLAELPKILEFNYATHIDDLISKTLQTLNIDQLIQKIAEQITQKKIFEILSHENTEEVPKEILNQIRQLFASDVSEDIIQILLKFLFGLLKEEKTTVFELLTQDLKDKFDKFLAEKLPDILTSFIPWIQQKKDKLENLIQKAFEQNVNIIGRMIVNLFIGNVGKYVGIEKKLIDLIEKQDPQELAKQASSYLIDYLQKNTIGQIVQKLNETKMVEMLSPIVNQNIRNSLNFLRLDDLDNLLDKPLNTWFSAENLAIQLRKLLDNTLENQLKKQFIYDKKLSNWVQTIFENKAKEFYEQPFEGLISKQNLPNYAQKIKAFAVDYIENHPKNASKLIQKTLEDFIKNKKIFDLFAQNQNILASLMAMLEIFLDNEFEKIAQKPLNHYVQKLNNLALAPQLSSLLHQYLLQNLPDLMTGKVETLVQESLKNLPDDQLKKMVFKAMGEELQPLSWFGAFLGALTGPLGLIQLSSPIANTSLAGFIYGVTGWGTNWLAIKMLFRPYKAKKIPGTRWNVPFTPGVIAKHKARFAQSMGRFIGDKLLNPEHLQATFAKRQDELQAGFTQLISQDEYAILDKILTQNQATIHQGMSKGVDDFLQKQYQANDEGFKKWIEKYLEKHKNQSLSDIPTQSVEKNIFNQITQPSAQAFGIQEAQKRIEKAIQANQSIKDILPQNMLKGIYLEIEKTVENEIQKLKQKLPHIQPYEYFDLKIFEQKMDTILQNNLDQLLSREQEEQLKNSIFQFLIQRIDNGHVKQKIYDFLDEKLNSEFDSARKIKDIFGGNLMALFEENLNQILKNIIQVGLKWLDEKKEEIAEKVYLDASKSSALAWTYKNAIKETTLDLIEKGIPTFFDMEFESFEALIHEKIIHLGESTLNTENIITLNTESLQDKINQILKNEKLLRKTRQLSNLILEERIFKIQIHRLVKGDAHTLLKDIQNVLHPEMDLFKQHLLESTKSAEDLAPLSKSISNFLLQILKREVLSVRFSYLLQNTDNQAIERAVQGVFSALATTKNASADFENMIQAGFKKIKSHSLDDFMEANAVASTLQNLFESTIADEELQKRLKAFLEDFTKNIIPQLNAQIPKESKDFITEQFAKVIFATLEAHILPLVNSLNFKEIVVREIEKMPAQELEKLFNGFASRYFTYLINYGFGFGIVFGLAIDLGIWAITQAL